MPASWLHLARTHAARRDTPARLEALERALAISPGWQDAARERIDALDLDGRRKEALEAAREGVRVTPLESASHGYLADLLLRDGAAEEGLGCLETAVRLHPGYDWAWDRLAQAAPQGPGDRLLAAAAAAAARRPGDAASWLILARARMARERYDEALEAVERGLELSPRDTGLLDRRAWLLFSMDRPADALAACTPPVFGGVTPRELKARKGWILLMMEREKEAVPLLEELAAAEKDQSWPLELLHRAHREAGRRGPALDAANLLRERWPESAQGHRLAAEALVRLERHSEATDAALTALRIDPYDARAASLAFDGQLTQGDTEGAADTLEIMRRLHPGPDVLTAEFRLEAKRSAGSGTVTMTIPTGSAEHIARASLGRQARDAEAVMETLLAILKDPSQDAAESFGQLVKSREYGTTIDKALNKLPEAEYQNRAALEHWADRHSANASARLIRKLRRSAIPPERRDVMIEFLLYRMHALNAGMRASRIVRWHRRFFRSTTTLWGAAGYIQLTVLGGKAGRQWYRGWEEREDIQSHMLHNCAASQALGPGPFAAEPARRALMARPDSGVLGMEARAGVALCQAMRGEREQARETLEALNLRGLPQRGGFLAALARCALAAGDNGPAAGGSWAEKARQAYPNFLNDRSAKKACRELKTQLRRHRLPTSFAPSVPLFHGQGGGWLIPALVLAIGAVGKCASYVDTRQFRSSESPPSVIPRKAPQAPVPPALPEPPLRNSDRMELPVPPWAEPPPPPPPSLTSPSRASEKPARPTELRY